jgi:hypothetical protein
MCIAGRNRGTFESQIKTMACLTNLPGMEAIHEDAGIQGQEADLTGFLAEDELPDSYSMLELEK